MRRFQMRGVIFGLAALFATTLVTSGAQANTVDNIITLQGGTNYFGAVHTDNFDFTVSQTETDPENYADDVAKANTAHPGTGWSEGFTR